MEKDNKIFATRVTQNNQEFLLSVVKVSTLKRYTKYTERIITEFDENNFPIYNYQIQRKSDPSKVKAIANFLRNDPQAMFPTNIVLAVPSFVIDEFEENDKKVTITLNAKVEEELNKDGGDVYISVIDGQHRLRGIELAITELSNQIDRISYQAENDKELSLLKSSLKNLLNFEIPTTFFIDPVLEYQASIFSTINRTQTKVSESLVYSLFGLTDKVSPQKSALEITLSLNSFKGSPFYNRIKLVGWAYKRGESPVLTQAAMVKSIIRCISSSAKESEIDRFKPRSELKKGINPDLCFREFYANNEDANISKIMYAYFEAIRQSFKAENQISFWDLEAPSNILQTTVGYEAFLSLLKLILKDINDKIVKKEKTSEDRFKIIEYKEYLAKAKLIEFENFEKYPKASISKRALLEDLRAAVFNYPQPGVNQDA